MKKVLACFAVFALSFLVACSNQNSFYFLSGEKKSIDDYRGQWLIINFWAEWCPPCLEEIPELGKLVKENPDIAVIGVSYDKLTNQELEGLVEKLDIQYPIVATEPMPYLPVAKPQSLPGTYLISPSGQVMGPILGKIDRSKILKIIKKVEGKANS